MKNIKILLQNYYKHYQYINSHKDDEEPKKRIEESPYLDSVEKIRDIVNKNPKEGWKLC